MRQPSQQLTGYIGYYSFPSTQLEIKLQILTKKIKWTVPSIKRISDIIKKTHFRTQNVWLLGSEEIILSESKLER